MYLDTKKLSRMGISLDVGTLNMSCKYSNLANTLAPSQIISISVKNNIPA